MAYALVTALRKVAANVRMLAIKGYLTDKGREHVHEVQWRAGQVYVIDLESTNGTEVERWAGHGFLPSRPVPTDKEMFLSGKDRLVLGGTVQLRLSGRRFVTDTPAQSVPPGQVTPPAGRAPAAGDTTIIDHPILERRRSDPPS